MSEGYRTVQTRCEKHPRKEPLSQEPAYVHAVVALKEGKQVWQAMSCAQDKRHVSRSGTKDNHQQETEDVHGLETHGHAQCKAARAFAAKPDKGQGPRPSRRVVIPHMREHSSNI